MGKPRFFFGRCEVKVPTPSASLRAGSKIANTAILGWGTRALAVEFSPFIFWESLSYAFDLLEAIF
jgi:hypothetical protein